MSSRKTSLGTVCALVTLATATTQATPILSSLTDVPFTLGNTLNIDINGDGQDDFTFVQSGNTAFMLQGIVVDNQINDDGTTTGMQVYQSGDVISVIDASVDHEPINSFFGTDDNFYAGVRFQIGGTNHMGWLEFSFPASTPSDGILVAAAWESVTDASITAGAVPEPGASRLSLFLGLPLALVGWWRRRSSSVAN